MENLDVLSVRSRLCLLKTSFQSIAREEANTEIWRCSPPHVYYLIRLSLNHRFTASPKTRLLCHHETQIGWMYCNEPRCSCALQRIKSETCCHFQNHRFPRPWITVCQKKAESRRLSAYVFDARSQKRDMLQIYTVKVNSTLMLFRLNTIICGVKAIFITSKWSTSFIVQNVTKEEIQIAA